jgi:protein transport protein SEC13
VASIDTGHDDMVHDAQLDYYGKWLATCSSDKTVRIFDVIGDTHTLTAELREHEGPVWQVVWAHLKFGNLLASCSYDKRVVIWKETANGWEPVYRNHDHESSVNSIAWAPHEYNRPILACGSSDGNISVFQFKADKWSVEHINKAHSSGVTSVSWGPVPVASSSVQAGAGLVKRLVSGGCDSTVKIWRCDEREQWSMTPEAVLNGHANWVRDVAWAPSLGFASNTIASCAQDGLLIIWTQDRSSGQSSSADKWDRKELRNFGFPVWRVSWSVTGNVLAVSGADNKVTLWKESLEGDWVCVSEVEDSA